MLSLAEAIEKQYRADLERYEKNAVILCGPTASGKTALSLSLCGALGGEIVSCDSMQIYKYMDIGTAKATEEERRTVPHHMIDVAEPWENYSVYQYKKGAETAIRDILARGKTPVLAGGTGLYVNSLLDNRAYSENDGSVYLAENGEARMREAERLAEAGEAEALHAMLSGVDPEAAQEIHPNNQKRVLRALSLYYTTGKTREIRNAESLLTPAEIHYRVYCLNPPRDVLYGRINKRVGEMMERGLPQEAEMVYNMCRRHGGSSQEEGSAPEQRFTSLQAIGYKELIPLFSAFPEETRGGVQYGEALREAAERIRQNSRRYAKKQITWFKKTPGVIFTDGERFDGCF